MLQHLKNNSVIKFLWGFMAFYILNCCIDVPGNNFIKEDISVNKQESILELIIEKLLGFENAVAEYDECDSDGGAVKKIVTIDFFIAPPIIQDIQKGYPHSKKQGVSFNSPKIMTAFFEIHSPPPDL